MRRLAAAARPAAMRRAAGGEPQQPFSCMHPCKISSHMLTNERPPLSQAQICSKYCSNTHIHDFPYAEGIPPSYPGMSSYPSSFAAAITFFIPVVKERESDG